MQNNLNYEDEIKEEVNNEVEEEIEDDGESFEQGSSAETTERKKWTAEEIEEMEKQFDSDDDDSFSEGDTLTPTDEGQDVEDDDDDLGNYYNPTTDNSFSEEKGNQVENVKYVPQSKVNEIAAQARKEGRESAMRELLLRYGVGSNDELDDLFGKGQSYTDLDNDFNIQNSYYRDALAENALLKTGINQDRWEDVKLILGGKNLEITPENIESHLASHPEWKGNNAVEKKALTPEMAQGYMDNIGNRMNVVNNDKPTTLKKLGNEASPVQPEMTEEELARKLYGFK